MTPRSGHPLGLYIAQEVLRLRLLTIIWVSARWNIHSKFVKMKIDLVSMLVTTCSNAVLSNNQSLRATNLKRLHICTQMPLPHRCLYLLRCTLEVSNLDCDFDFVERVVGSHRNPYSISSRLSHSSGRDSSTRRIPTLTWRIRISLQSS